MEDYINTLGRRIRERRLELNITQEDLSIFLGVTPQYISFIEQNKGLPSIPVLAKLAQALGVSIDYLVSGKESVVTDVISAVKADKFLSIKAKKALINLIEELYTGSENITEDK